MTPQILHARTPEDLLAAVPVVLGFEPEDSVVVLTVGGRSFHARVDLPPPHAAEEVARLLLRPALDHNVSGVVLIAYTRDRRRARRVVRTLVRAFGGEGIGVIDAIHTDGRRWYPVTGHPGVPDCGVPYDIGSHEFTARSVFSGRVIHKSRSELAATLEEAPDLVAEVAAHVDERAVCDREEVTRLVRRHLGSGSLPAPVLARLLPSLRDGDGRQGVWVAMTRENAAAHVLLWSDAVRRTPRELRADVAAVLAVAAWVAGSGALAWCAVDRCLESRPDHPLATLVGQLLNAAVPPDCWEEVVRSVLGG